MVAMAYIFYKGKWQEIPVYNTATFSVRYDETLDGGTLITKNDSAEPYPQCMPVRLGMLMSNKDDETNGVADTYISFDKVEVRGKNNVIHGLTLVEPSRLLMGITIDGMKVVQPTDGSTKKSLYDVLERLIHIYKTHRAMFSVDNEFNYSVDTDNSEQTAFTIPTSGSVYDLLKNTESAEFEWQAETLLWEALCDIGNVINCIPRLEQSDVDVNQTSVVFDRITFDDINKDVGTYELL